VQAVMPSLWCYCSLCSLTVTPLLIACYQPQGAVNYFRRWHLLLAGTKQVLLPFVLPFPQGALDYSDFGSVDMVIEAAIEDVGLKQNIFADLERACRK